MKTWTLNVERGVFERRYIGRHRAPKPARPVAPLARPIGDVEIASVGLFAVLTHLADGRTVDDAWALGEIDALDMRQQRALVTP